MSIAGANHVRRFAETHPNSFLAHSLREKAREIEQIQKEVWEAIDTRPGIAARDEEKGWVATFGRSVLFREGNYVRGTGGHARDMKETIVQSKFDRAVEEEVWEALKVWENAKEDYERNNALDGTYGGSLPIVLRQAGDELVYVWVGSQGNRTLTTVMGLWDDEPRHVPIAELSLPHLPFVGMEAEASFLEKVCPVGAIVVQDEKPWIRVHRGWLSEYNPMDALPLPCGVYRVRMFTDFS